MFGFFKKRPDHLDRLQALVELGVEFSRLQKDAPAAAWFFARNLYNSRPLLELDDTPEAKLAYIETEMSSKETAASTRADGGMSVFAMRFLMAYMQALKRKENEYAFEVTLGVIIKSGQDYRDLRYSDHIKSTNKEQIIVLAANNCDCLYDLITQAEREGGVVPRQYKDTVIAGFDIKEEAASGRLWPHVQTLESIISRL